MITDIYRIKTRNSIYEIQVCDQDGTSNRPSRCRKDGDDDLAQGLRLHRGLPGEALHRPGFHHPRCGRAHVQREDYVHFVPSSEPKRKAKALRGSETGIPEFFEMLADHVQEQVNPHRAGS